VTDHQLQNQGGNVCLRRALRVSLLATITGLPFVVLGAAAPTATASTAPITIAYITDETGQAGAENGPSPVAFEARLDMQNAEGGVNGHKLVPLVIDDQTNPSEITTAVQDAISKGAFAIVSQSVLMFLAAKYPQQAGMPVTGAYTDGPEWGTKPYTNMFASDEGSVDPRYPANTTIDSILKAHGGTVVGAYGYGISPTSTRAAEGDAEAATHLGLKVGVLNTTVPFGSVAFTSDALVAKQDHVNALVPSLDNNSNYALAEALKQAGVKLKAVVFATGYEPDVIHSPAWSAVQGDYFVSLYRPWVLPNAGTEQMQGAMEKYAGFTKSDFPSFSQYEAWAGADLMIKGLELAGKNPTRAAVIKDLRGLKSYTANGLLPEPIDYSTIFGHDLPRQCSWVMQAEKNGFVPVSSQPVCGMDIPGTATAGSP
jgi:branched-chain amino acid transport system substrate-binding protein